MLLRDNVISAFTLAPAALKVTGSLAGRHFMRSSFERSFFPIRSLPHPVSMIHICGTVVDRRRFLVTAGSIGMLAPGTGLGQTYHFNWQRLGVVFRLPEVKNTITYDP